MLNVTKLAQKVLPPILFDSLENVINTRKHSFFSSYQHALSHCSKNGYENDVLIDVLTYKMGNYLKSQKSNEDKTLTTTQSFTLLALTKLMVSYPNRDFFHILDFGGNLGGHYYDVKKVFGDSIKLKWAVVETPALAKAGQQFATEELSFFDSIESAAQFLGNIDLLHTSGTLQCVENPRQYLDQLLKLKANFILFNRLAVNRKNTDIVTIHHSKLNWNGFPGLPPGVEDRIISYPFTFMSEQDFFNILAADYQIDARFSDNTGILPVPSQEIVGGGLLVSRC